MRDGGIVPRREDGSIDKGGRAAANPNIRWLLRVCLCHGVVAVALVISVGVVIIVFLVVVLLVLFSDHDLRRYTGV